MTLFDIKEALADILKMKLPDYKVYAKEVKEGTVKPYFSIEVIPVSVKNRIYYKDVSVTVNIRYYSKDETYEDIMAVSGHLAELFDLSLAVGDRVLTIESPEIEAPDENGTDYMQFSFDLNFQEGKEVLEVEVETEQGTITQVMLPDPARGYTEDTIDLIGELALNDEQEG